MNLARPARCLLALATCLIFITEIHCTTVRQTESSESDDNGLSAEADQFLNISELKNVDPREFLEVEFINNSVNHYRTQLQRVRSSLQEQIQELVSNVRDMKHQFSPELRAKLNESVYKFIDSLELSWDCKMAIAHIRNELLHRRLWPLKFIDAMELVPTGALEGILSTLGLFEECINIQSPHEGNSLSLVKGKYCLAKVHLPFLNPEFPSDEPEPVEYDSDGNVKLDLNKLNFNTIKKFAAAKLNQDYEVLNNKLKLLQMINVFNGSHFRVGLCFPSSCSSFELERAINKFLEPLQNPVRIEIEEECSVKDQEVDLDNYQRVAILVLVVMGGLVAASTCYEYYLMRYRDQSESTKNPYEAYLLTFSAISNTQALFEPDERRLCAVDTITLAFVLLEFVGRSYVLPVFYGMINIKRPMNGLPNEFFTARKFFFIRGSSFAICTYILASSIVLAYKICSYKQHVKPSLVNYLKYVANRWFSLVRRMIGPIFLIYLLPLFGDGPLWHYFKQIYTEPCKHNLLPTFLFYSNYEPALEQVCNGPSVLFSSLFWPSLLAPIILYTLNHKLGYIIFVFLLVLGLVASLIPKMIFKIPIAPYEVSSMVSIAQSKLSFIHYFAATDQLIVAFAIGFFVGFLIKCKPKINLGKQFAQIALWLGLLALPMISTQWNENFKPLDGNFSQFSFMTWFFLSKLMWCSGFSWVMFSCCTGRAGPINDIMSIPIIRPLTRLAFGIYINHITVLSFRQLTKKEMVPLAHVEILTDDIADIVIAVALAYVFYLLIEKPAYHWIKIVLQLEPAELPPVKRFCASDLENGKLKEEIDLKPLNDVHHRHTQQQRL